MRTDWRMWAAPLCFILGACAGLNESPAPAVHYQCESGKRFSLTVSADAATATIEFDRMRFPLRAVEPSGEAGERFACDVMSVVRSGQTARVEMDGDSPFRNCVRVPAP